MQVFLQQLQKVHNRKDLMREACSKNQIGTSQAGQLTPKKLSILYQRFEKAYKLNQSPNDGWGEHQKRAFNWVLIAISALKNMQIAHFGGQEWGKLYQIFQHKTQNFLRYETRRFLLEKSSNKRWTDQEDESLVTLIMEQEKKHKNQPNEEQQIQVEEEFKKNAISWNQIAHKLFQQSQQNFFRTPKQCKQRWQNHLDPTKQRGQWNVEQEMSLLHSVEKQGKKWAKIAAAVNRTEHCVKNKYNSIISQQRKLTPSLRKQQKLVEQAKKRMKIVPTVQEAATTEPKTKKKLKKQPQIMQQDDQLLNRGGSFITINQVQNKFKPDNQSNFRLQGQHLINNFIREDTQNKNDNYTLTNTFWLNSPNLITPNGLTPSPMSSYGYPISHHFFTNLNAFMPNYQPNQRQAEERK